LLNLAAARAAALTLLIVAPCQAAKIGRPFTVRDAIEATRPVDPSINGVTEAERAPQVSPDGRRFFVVTQRGILDTNENEYRLQVFEVAQRGAEHVSVTDAAVLRSVGNVAAITEASWIANDTIVFRGAQARDTPQIWMAHVHGELQMRTAEPAGVLRFAANARGDLIYLTVPVPDDASVDDALGGGYVVEKHLTALDLLGDTWKGRVGPQRGELKHLAAGARRPTPIEQLDLHPNHARIVNLWMSPDGRQAALLLPTSAYLEQWDGYENADIKAHVTRARGYRSGAIPPGFPYPQYFLIDLVSHDRQPLVVAPALLWKFIVQPDVVWSPGGKSLLLFNTMFPLDRLEELSESGRELALRFPAVLEVDVRAGRVSPLLFIQQESTELASPSWTADGRRIILYSTDTVSRERQRVVFERRGSAWVQREAQPARVDPARPAFAKLLDGRVEAGIDQGINLPPKVLVREHASGRLLHAAELNPQLADIELTPMETIQWTDEAGTVWTGGLMYPASHRPGERYPLVIQTHGYNPREFLFDTMMFGGDRPAPFTGMSARALAARGFFVLQDHQENDHASARYDTPDEGPQFIRSYRAAIAALAARGLVDPARVGFIGFSRTSYQVKYLLAHAEFPIAAAAIADGVDFGYFQTLLADSAATAQRFYDGAAPLGAGLQKWLHEAPTFNAHRFRTPLRIEAIDVPWVTTEYEMYAALRLAGVPTELTVYPDGRHRLLKPRERFRSQQSNVDWMDFWINGKESSDAGTREAQYWRWRALRDSWRPLQ